MRFYFDNNANTPLAPAARDAWICAIEQGINNPSCLHAEGREARRQLDQVRLQVASGLDCLPEEIYFSSGATEANNVLLNSVWEKRVPGRNKIISSSVEHDSLFKPLMRLAEKGAEIIWIKTDAQGRLDEEGLMKALDARTLLVTLMAANNETGICFPIAKWAPQIRASGAFFHTDAACAVGKMPLSFRKLGVDFLSLSANKFYGPKGVGALLIHRGLEWEPTFLGGNQERGRRAGTENVEGITALGAALNFSLEGHEEENTRQWRLRRQIQEGLKQIKPDVIFHEGPEEAQLPGTLNVAFPGQRGEVLLARLDLEGVAASMGSACQSGVLKVSRVLLAMGIEEEEVDSSIRFSFGRMTTEADVEGLLGVLKRILNGK